MTSDAVAVWLDLQHASACPVLRTFLSCGWSPGQKVELLCQCTLEHEEKTICCLPTTPDYHADSITNDDKHTTQDCRRAPPAQRRVEPPSLSVRQSVSLVNLYSVSTSTTVHRPAKSVTPSIERSNISQSAQPSLDFKPLLHLHEFNLTHRSNPAGRGEPFQSNTVRWPGPHKFWTQSA